MSAPAKPFNVTVERVVPTHDGNRLVCVKAKQKRWSLSVPSHTEIREGMTISVVETGAGTAAIATRALRLEVEGRA